MTENVLKLSSPSQQVKIKPAPVAGFRFLDTFTDKTKTLKHLDYKPAKIYRGKQWFVFYSFRDPETSRFQRFRVYEDINRVPLSERESYAELLKDAVNFGLKNGYNPFAPREPVLVVKNWTLGQGLNYFKTRLPERGLRKRTVQSYESVLRMLNKELKPLLNESISEVSKKQISIALFNAKKSNGWSNGTFNNNVSFTRAIFNYLIDQEICKENPAARIKPLPEQITKHRYFDNETFKRIKEKADPELLSFIMFLYHTGTRPNEARQLTSENILRERKLLFIPASVSKNKKDDYVPLSDYVLKNYRKEGKLFDVSVNYFGQKFAKLKKELKLQKDFTLYSIKATRAIHLAQDGANPYTIMSLFRHSSLEITMSYLRDLNVTVNRESVEKGIRF